MANAHNSSRGPIPSPKTNTTGDPAIWRSVTFDDWGPEHCDWRSGQGVSIRNDGLITVWSSYVSNKWSNGPFGAVMRFYVEIKLFNNKGQQVGPRVDCGVALLNPFSDKSDINNAYSHPEIVDVLKEAELFVVFQHIDDAN